MKTITITAKTDYDPYSAYWAELSATDLSLAEKYFTDSPAWTLSNDLSFDRTATLFAEFECDEHQPRIYLTAEPETLNAAADAVEKILRRGPDCLT